MFKDLDNVRLSVSKTFDVHDQHVHVEGFATKHDAGVMISINHAGLDYLKWSMLTDKAKETVDCRVFGLSVTHCGLEPKLPQCKDCPLNR